MGGALLPFLDTARTSANGVGNVCPNVRIGGALLTRIDLLGSVRRRKGMALANDRLDGLRSGGARALLPSIN
jgi:hypothetical protein